MKSSEEMCKMIGDVLHLKTRNSYKCPKTFILDDDFDPCDDHELIWALSTRIHPDKRKIVYEGAVMMLLTCYSPEEHLELKGSKVVHDGLRPVGAPAICSFADSYPDAIKRRILAHWAEDFK